MGVAVPNLNQASVSRFGVLTLVHPDYTNAVFRIIHIHEYPQPFPELRSQVSFFTKSWTPCKSLMPRSLIRFLSAGLP